MRLLGIIVFAGLMVFLGAQVYSSLGRGRELAREFQGVSAKLGKADAEQQKLGADLKYFLNPANLEKEIRARFNYRSPEETLVIIVPQPAASSAASGTPAQ